ncbi:MAG: electron transfer flavoprotein subunit beta/FixA family protein [Spirochaetota bacterium]
MKIICVVKIVPDVDSFAYDYQNNTLIRENIRMILNPDDACALAVALKVKAGRPTCTVEVVSMGPPSVRPHMEDLLRLDTDRGTIISDPAYKGSDTFVTSRILARYLSGRQFDVLLTGSHALDGDTSHVPAQIAEELGLEQMSGITAVDPKRFDAQRAVFEVEYERSVVTWEIALPAVLSLDRESGYKLPYVKYEDFQKDVSHKLNFIGNSELGFAAEEVGSQGSLTQVVRTYTQNFETRERSIVHTDDEGIETVFNYLVEKGFLFK